MASAARPAGWITGGWRNLNGIYIRQADDERLTREVLERLAHRTELALGGKAVRAYPRADAGA